MRFNHAGKYHEPFPNNLVNAGINIILTTKASKSTPNANAIPIDLIMTSSWNTNAKKTLNMINAAATITGPLSFNPTLIE
ncbi:Uncharacterised protein [Staphylococcus aureus]|nr:Uncharacterised protein [Staphylococcus aureus]